MTAATAVPPEVDAYLGAVRAELFDLDEVEREDLLAEVEASLAEAAADTSGPLEDRLGPPAAFAAELRSAAGLHSAAAARSGPPFLEELRAFAARIVASPRIASAARVARELAPIWWVARAYFAVGAIAYLIDAQWSSRYPIIPQLGPGVSNTAANGAIIIALAIVLSIVLGLRARRNGAMFPRAAAALNVLLALAIIPTLAEVTNTQAYDVLVASAYAPTPEPAGADGLWYGGVRVDNVYPYSRDGKLLHDVLLYDGVGRPLELRGTDPNRRLLLGVDGEPIFNVFPIRYFEPGTRRVERPGAAPQVELPEIATPPLRTRP